MDVTDHDHDGTVDGRWPFSPPAGGPFIAVRNRAAGSPSVYFGPFATWSELVAWLDSVGFVCEVWNLTDPYSPRDGWWD